MKLFQSFIQKLKENKKNNNTNKKTNKINENEENIFKYIFPIITIAILVILTDMVYNSLNFGNTMFVSTIGGFICSFIIVYTLFLLFWGITNKSSVSLGIVTILMLFINAVNQIKILYMSEPVYLTDVYFLKAMGETTNMINGTFLSTIEKYIPLSIVVIILLGVFIYILARKDVNISINNIKNRLALTVAPVIVLVLLFVPNKTTKEAYLDMFFGANDVKNYNYIISTSEYYKKYGVVAGIYGQFLESKVFEPDNYDEEQLIGIMENVEQNKSTIGKPNIIVILSESFWDMSVLDEITFDKQVTPNYNKLKEQGLLFDMISPTYGGTTANVEMQILTGFNLAYYNRGYIPYLQLYNSNMKNRPSIVQELNNNGYITRIVKHFIIENKYILILEQTKEYI